MTITLNQGIPIQVMKFRPNAALGVTSWGVLTSILPDPQVEETQAMMRYQQRAMREHAELRNSVQRLLKGTAKGRNVGPYAAYIAAGLRGDLGNAWSTPPLCLWSSRPLKFTDEANGLASLPLGYTIVAIDAETQVASIHQIMNHPEDYDLGDVDLAETPVAFELYWDIEESDARQIFHDRNLRGVAVPKPLALAMDQRDLGTILTNRAVAIAEVEIKVDGQLKNMAFKPYVNSRKRQLAKNDQEWITLSAMRAMSITTLLGKSGIEHTSGVLEDSDLPAGVTRDDALNEVPTLMAVIIREFGAQFAARSAITAPAVLGGIGALAHRATSWSTEKPQLTREQVIDVLAVVHWDREAKYWEGVAAKPTARSDGLSFAGGVKDSSYRVYEALANADSDLGRRIRGRS
jgi:hypothetical protein